jgi:SOS-response transcriptional repressor LexA
MNTVDTPSPSDDSNLDRFAVHVGNAVNFYRTKAGLTLADLATTVGVNKSSISKIENGKQGYTGETIKKIAEALGISATDIFNYAEFQTDHDTANRLINWVERSKIDTAEVVEDYGLAGINTTAVPLISWVQAGDWREIVSQEHWDTCAAADAAPYEMIPTTYKKRPHTYALRVHGDSMEPKFPKGCIIIVEPEEDPMSGSYVIVRQNGSEATFKQLVLDGDVKYLKPLNDRYPIMELRKDAVFCGVVKRMEMEF